MSINEDARCKNYNFHFCVYCVYLVFLPKAPAVGFRLGVS